MSSSFERSPAVAKTKPLHLNRLKSVEIGEFPAEIVVDNYFELFCYLKYGDSIPEVVQH